MSTLRTVPAPPFSLVEDGLVLREWTDADLALMPALFDDPDVARWTPLASPFDAEAAKRYLERARETRGGGRRLQLAVTTDGDAPLGEVTLMLRDPDGQIEIGYAIGALYRGRGLSTRAVRLLIALAYDALDADRIILRIEPDNAASSAVARSAGFRLAAESPVQVKEPDGSTITLNIWEHVAGDVAPSVS